MKILLTGFIRPLDLQKYFFPSSEKQVVELSKGVHPGVPLSDLATQLLENGHLVTVISMNQNTTQEIALFGKNLKVVLIPLSLHYRIRTATLYLPLIREIHQAIRKQDFDVIHSHWAGELSLAALLYSRDILVTFHDNPFKIFLN